MPYAASPILPWVTVRLRTPSRQVIHRGKRHADSSCILHKHKFLQGYPTMLRSCAQSSEGEVSIPGNHQQMLRPLTLTACLRGSNWSK
jgi:hypothetical protein